MQVTVSFTPSLNLFLLFFFFYFPNLLNLHNECIVTRIIFYLYTFFFVLLIQDDVEQITVSRHTDLSRPTSTDINRIFILAKSCLAAG